MKQLKQSSLILLMLITMLGTNEAQSEDGLYAELTTSKGKIVLKLEFEKTPMTVANFVGLAEGTIDNKRKGKGEPYYDGLKFHRVIADFMIQGGCPHGNGSGDPGYKFPDEIHPDLKHSSGGILSMANSGPNTNGSQFFITHKETPWLDGKHTVFGSVVGEKDQAVVNAIAQGDELTSIKIIRKGAKAEGFNASEVFKDKVGSWLADQEKKKQEAIAAFESKVKEKYPDAKSTESGLRYVMHHEGEGDQAVAGKTVAVHYTGTLFENGSKFDSSLDRGQPIEFPLGQGRVIKGWDEGIAMLKKGGKATFIIPPHLGYGERGYPPVIPQNAVLVFEVELVDIK